MGPLVDVVRQAVAPRLEELRRGPRVIDLVEVHLVRLGEAEGPQRHRGQDQDDQEPQVEPVEAAAALAGQRARSGRPGWTARRAAGGTIRSVRARPSSGAATRWASRRPRLARPRRHRRGAASRRPQMRRRRPRSVGDRPGRRRRLGPRSSRRASPAVGSEAASSSRARRAWARPRSWSSAQTNPSANTTATAAMAGSDLRVGPIPSQSHDLRVVGDQHDEDHVHVREQARGSGPRT